MKPNNLKLKPSGIFLMLLAGILLLNMGPVSAAAINDTLHINLQTTYSNGSIETGTFIFTFNITENSSSSCGAPVVYNHSTTLATDTRGIVSLYLPTLGSDGGNLSALDFDKQYYLCYYRDGTLKDVSQLGRVPYSFRATQVNLSEINIDSNLTLGSYNVSANYGFFSFLGSLLSRITKIFATDVDISNNLSVGGNVSVTGNVTADWFIGNMNASYVQNAPWIISYTETDPYWTANYTNYYTKAEVTQNISDANTSMKSYVDSQDVVFNDSMKAYVDQLNSTGLIRDWNATGYIVDWNSTGYIKNWTVDIFYSNGTMKSYVDSQDVVFNDSMKAYVDALNVSQGNWAINTFIAQSEEANLNVNGSEWWLTAEGALNNVADILGSWINNNLNWLNQTGADALYVTRGNWSTHDNYPSGCAAGEAVQIIGDTLTCINISAQGSDTLDGYDSSFFMPLNTSVVGTFDFNGGWTAGGLSIDGGDLYAQTIYVYNITSLNVTEQNLSVVDDLLVFGNTNLKKNLSVDTDTLFVDATNDRVGIGTVSPQNTLNVVGGANVTGFSITDDSLVTLADSSKKKIKDIEAGEYVLTLDEETGRLVSRRVNALLDHGIQGIYEMTTESGKAINTTAEHPYLVKINMQDYLEEDNNLINSSVVNTSTKDCSFRCLSLDQIGNLSFNANAIKSTSFLSGIPEAFCKNFEYSFSGMNSTQIPKSILNSLNCSKEIPVFCNISDVFLFISSNAYSGAKNSKSWSSNIPLLNEFSQKKVNNTFVSTTSFIYISPLLFNSLNLPFLDALCSLTDQSIISFSSSNCLTNLFNSIDNSMPLFCILSFNSSDNLIFISSMNEKSNDDYLKLSQGHNQDNAAWIEVMHLKPGDKIAVPDYETGGIKWEKISSIRVLEPQHVYDLAIEGTRNFIANDLVAHNTYLGDSASDVTTVTGNLSVDSPTFFVDSVSDRVGVGTTSPGEKLEVVGGIKIGTTSIAEAGIIRWTGSDFQAYNGTAWNSFGSGGVGSLWSQSGNDIYFDTGNVGIGTATPKGGRLNIVGGDLNMSGNKIISLANATDLQDAVTLSQLQAVNATAGNAVPQTRTLEMIGTSDQITVSPTGPQDLTQNRQWTFTLPQNINITSSPTFTGLTLSGLTQGSVLFTGANGLLSQNNTHFYWDNINGRLGLGTNNPNGKLHTTGGNVIFEI